MILPCIWLSMNQWQVAYITRLQRQTYKSNLNNHPKSPIIAFAGTLRRLFFGSSPISQAAMVNAKQKAQGIIDDNSVVVFSKSYCPYCKATKSLLDTKGAKYFLMELDQVCKSHQPRLYVRRYKTMANFSQRMAVHSRMPSKKLLASEVFQISSSSKNTSEETQICRRRSRSSMICWRMPALSRMAWKNTTMRQEGV